MERRGGIYFLIAIMIVMLAMVINFLGEDSLEAKLLPIVLGSTAFMLSAVGLVRALSQRRKLGTNVVMGDQVGEAEVTGGSGRGYLIAGGWVLGFFLAIYLLGFIIAIPLLIVAYMRTYRATWLMGSTSAVVTIASIYGLFEFLLGVQLYRGLIFDLLRG